MDDEGHDFVGVLNMLVKRLKIVTKSKILQEKLNKMIAMIGKNNPKVPPKSYLLKK